MTLSSYRLGVDVGGTFTDTLLLDETTGQTWRSKTPSTPQDQSVGVLNGINEILDKIPSGSDISLDIVNHGTTVSTNALLEGKGAKVALITTEGHKDVLQTRRSQVPGGLASWIIWKKPEPLADLALTVEAPGRIGSDGVEVRPFDADVFTKRLEAIISAKPEAITVSLLNSFANSSHEQQVSVILRKLFPNTSISLSSEVLPEMMEYERTITSVANAYVEPKVSLYLRNLIKSLEGKAKTLRILRSDGGLSSPSLASRFPVTLALSGPAGGVTGVVSAVADQTKFKNLVTIDMGGTSTDVALIENSVPRIRRETHIGDLVVKAPSIDVRTVGAGGGSIARVPDITKALRVGPESAGAVPGPACYGEGAEATVTDANVVLGYLPKYLLGGTFKLDINAARKSVQKVADSLGIGLYEAAESILQIANETMYGALRLVSVEQGYDPRDFSLVAFGGAGPLHANSLGKLLQAWPVIIPPSPGVLCAWGDATTLLRHESSMTYIRVIGETSKEEIASAFDSLKEQVGDIMRVEQNVPTEKQVYKYQADLRYLGQAIIVSVNIDASEFKAKGLRYIQKLFEDEHKRLFTYSLSSDVEIMNLRIVAEEVKPDLTIKKLEVATSPVVPESAITGRTTLVYAAQEFDSPIYNRLSLKYGHLVEGPCVVTEMDSNTVILPGYKAEVDAVGNLLIWEKENAAQFDVDKAGNELNAGTVDVFENALRNARNEMDTLMTSATMSPAIREQVDEFNVIAEPSGKMLAGQFGSFIGQFLDNWKGTIEPDDIFITNDPYSVGGAISHLNDWLVLMPVYVNEKLIAWTSNFGHMTDNGGSVPGSLPTAGISIFEEGIQIPVTKLASKGVWNNALLEVLFRNSRLPDWVRADTAALVASCKLAAKRMIELYTRFGDKVYFDAINELLDRNKKAISSLINTVIPENPVYFEDWIDDDGRGVGPWKVACTMTKKEDGHLSFDFSETDPQSSSSINYYLSSNMFKMFVGIYLITVYDPHTVVNDGFHDLVDFYVPKGTILNPCRPAALSTRTHLLGRIMDLLSGLLGQKAPEFMTAAGFSDSPHFMYSGFKPNGDWFQLYQIGFGGIPARPMGDGMDGHCLWPAMKAVPNEFLEHYYPLRIEEYNTVVDSGGAGFMRGGNGQRIFYRFLEEGEISTHDDRWLSKPWGVLGGEPGARSSKTLVHYAEDPANPRREILPSKMDHIKVSEGDVLEWITWGGGGWGDALKRDPALVALEVHRGLISLEGAKRYGVVVKPDFNVDEEATKMLRGEMSVVKTNVKPEIFNRGGTWEEWKAKALVETGLPAPKAPWEVKMRGPHTGLPHIRKWMEKHGQLPQGWSGLNGKVH
ncbi:MAG: hypothetical protein M1834_001733 [Cirrosporium novae-zelandiae]|nr:MAG: hypothetical protein M1834_001733 [Cirrosporium novae-zelandiae]